MNENTHKNKHRIKQPTIKNKRDELNNTHKHKQRIKRATIKTINKGDFENTPKNKQRIKQTTLNKDELNNTHT